MGSRIEETSETSPLASIPERLPFLMCDLNSNILSKASPPELMANVRGITSNALANASIANLSLPLSRSDALRTSSAA